MQGRKTTVPRGEATRGRILRAAIRLFAARGFNGTTTRRIAQAARTNEALIFRHFPTKRDLYRAIIRHKIEGQPPASDLMKVGLDGDDAAFFRAVAGWMFDLAGHDPTLLRLLHFSGLEGHELSTLFFECVASGVHGMVTDRIAQRIKEGALRNTDPRMVARAFIGMIAHQLLARELFPQVVPALGREEMAAAFTDIRLHGIKTAPGKTARKKAAK